MAHRAVPAHAVPVAIATGPYATLTIYSGHASDGFKTEFTARAAYWWVITDNSGRVLSSRRYSGRARLNQLLRDWNEVGLDERITVVQPLRVKA